MTDYDLLITTNVSSTFQYQCQVTIQHHTSAHGNYNLTYGGPVTVLEKLGMKMMVRFNLPYINNSIIYVYNYFGV